MIKYILILFSFISISRADEDLCKYFKYCGGSSRASSQSLPSSSSAANLNPSNISSVKGFGIETIYQPKNPLSYDIVTGDGKIGALVSPTLENSFFGNRSIEIDQVYYDRRRDKIQYKNKKFNLAVGANLVNKSKVGLDFGLSVKRNPDIKKLNWGVGLSARLSFLNFGAYVYQDDQKVDLQNYINPYTYIPYSIMHNSYSYQEKFLVKTFTVGAKIKNLTLDYGIIQTRYKFYTEDTHISLFSSSLSVKKLLFSLAIRKEESPNLLFTNIMLVVSRKKSATYYGLDYLLNSSIVAGMQYNYYLLNEWSAKLTIFF